MAKPLVGDELWAIFEKVDQAGGVPREYLPRELLRLGDDLLASTESRSP